MPNDISYNVYETAKTLLDPQQLHDPSTVAGNLADVPKLPGIYAWWCDAELPDVSMSGSLERHGRRLIYVGICPNGDRIDSKRTLRHRMKEHCAGPIRRSTLRKTLASLLKIELGLEVGRSSIGKPILLFDGELRLSQWMGDHVRIAWMPHPSPWDLERQIIETVTTPLNIKGSSHPNVAILKRRRSEF